jgi:hypothetical protein
MELRSSDRGRSIGPCLAWLSAPRSLFDNILPRCPLRCNSDVGTRSFRFAIGFLLIALLLFAGPGFRSRAQLDEHYAKHGAEFGHISEAEYLRLAQELRDAPVGGPILEARRPNGQFSRFDRRQGYFGAYNPDGTIRTFFIPNDGERYFRRQARRSY